MLSNTPSEDPRCKARKGLCKLFPPHCRWSPAAGLRNCGHADTECGHDQSGLPGHSGHGHPHCLRCGSDFNSCFLVSRIKNKPAFLTFLLYIRLDSWLLVFSSLSFYNLVLAGKGGHAGLYDCLDSSCWRKIIRYMWLQASGDTYLELERCVLGVAQCFFHLFSC